MKNRKEAVLQDVTLGVINIEKLSAYREREREREREGQCSGVDGKGGT